MENKEEQHTSEYQTEIQAECQSENQTEFQTDYRTEYRTDDQTVYYNEIGVLTKEEIKRSRHKAEKRWYRRLVVLNILIIAAVLTLFFINLKENMKDAEKEWNVIHKSVEQATGKEKNTNEKSDRTKQLDKEIENISNNIPFEVEYSFIILAAMIALPFVVNYYYATYRTRALRITPNNFPEIYERIQLYSKRLGLKKVPEAYVVQENGILNAFSSFIIRKQYIQINADLFEIAYREYEDLESISFVAAHELSHIKLKHATFLYNLSIMFSSMIPVIGTTASRAREYSCDRLAQKITGKDGIEAMLALMVGKHLYKAVDVEDYIQHSYQVKGFFVWLYNLFCDHPIMTKRIRALAMKEGSGELY